MKVLLDIKKKETTSVLIFVTIFAVYSVISMTKSAYASAIASIIGEGIFNKSQAGTVNAGFYLLYGMGQLFGVKMVDKVSPVKFIYFTLFGTFVSTLGMAFARSFEAMLLLWSFCGLVQFAIWPAVLRIISEYLLPVHKDRAKVYISFSYCVGMLFSYLLASIVLKFVRWPGLFFVVSLIVLASLVIWIIVTRATKEEAYEIKKMNSEITLYFKEAKEKENNGQKPMGIGKIILMSGVFLLLIPSFVRSALDAGLKSWVPTMIVENYSVSASFANMMTTVLVFVNLSGVFIVNFFYPRIIKNAVLGYGLCFLVSIPFTVMLLFTGKIHLAVVVFLLIVVTTMMYSGHQLVNIIIPASFAKYNRAGAVAALINALGSFGSVVANILFGFLAENYGWNTTITSWIILGTVAVAFCAMAVPLWTKFNKGE